MHFLGDPAGVFLDGLHILRGNMPGRNDTRRVAGMHARQLYVLHHRRHKRMGAVADGIRLTFRGMIQKPVDQDGPVGSNAHRRFHVSGEICVVIHYLHASAAQHIGGTNHNGITYGMRNIQRLLHRGRHTGFRHGNLKLLHHGAEPVPVLRQIDNGRRRAQNLHAVFLQICSQV